MLSLVMPYWQRRAATDAALASMAAHYRDLNMEVVIVDDGSPEPYHAPAGLPWRVSVVRMPPKTGPLNPCTPFNRGVEFARGDVIGISNPENLHIRPVLGDLLGELEGKPNAYVMAGCRCGDTWHAHRSVAGIEVCGIRMPENGVYHFLAVMNRGLWDRAGGFDEDYRDGAGYDDPDLLLRLQRAGAEFVLRDDLVVEHIRENARAQWRPEQWERNKRVFQHKWARG